MAQDFRPRVSLAVIVLAPHPSPVQAGAHRKGGTNATPRHRHLSAEPTDVDTIHPRAARQPRRETGSWELVSRPSGFWLAPGVMRGCRRSVSGVSPRSTSRSRSGPSRGGSRRSPGPAPAVVRRAAPARRRRRTPRARSPVHPALGGHTGHRAAVIADRHRGCPAGSGGDPGPRRDVLRQRLGEHLPLTLRHPTTPFPFVPQQHWPIRSDPQIPRPGSSPAPSARTTAAALRAPPHQLGAGRAVHHPLARVVDQHPIDDQSFDPQQQRTTLVHGSWSFDLIA